MWYNGDVIGRFWQENRVLVRPFLILCLIYLVGISAIILSGVHYADDAARTNYGYAGWSAFSRYTSTILSHGLHADNYLTNIAPLLQLLAVGVLALSSIILIITISGKEIFEKKPSKWILKIVAVIPLGLCPYMLECMSYQYDAIYMALSVFFAVMPLCFYGKSTGLYLAAIVVGVLGVCTTYQASIGILPMLVVFVAMKDWSQKKKKTGEVLKLLFGSAAVSVVTLLVFQKFLMAPRDIYVSNELPQINDFIPSLFAHLGHYIELLFSDFKILWLVLMGVMACLFVILYVVRSKQNRIVSGVVGAIGLLVMGFLTYAFYAALDKPLYTTRAMYAVGALIAIIGVYIVSGGIVWWPASVKSDKKKEIKKRVFVGVNELILAVPVIAISWCFFSFGFTYGNMLKEQDEFRNRQIDMVISDLNEMDELRDGMVRYIQASGQIDFAPAIQHLPEKDYRIVRRLLKPSFGGDVNWMAYRLTEASGLPNLVFNQEVDLRESELTQKRETLLYTIYTSDNGVLVNFKGRSFQETVKE